MFFQGFEMRDNESVPSAQTMFGNQDVNRTDDARIEFNEVIDRSRPEHLWEKEGKEWKLKKPIWEDC